MKFIVSRTALDAVLQHLVRAIASKNSLPILECFVFELAEEVLTIHASDGENRITGKVKVSSHDGEGTFAIAARLLNERLSNLPEQPLTFDVSEENKLLTITYSSGIHTLPWQDGENFPSQITLKEDCVRFSLPTEKLLFGISSTAFAVSTDEFRPVMNGTYFDITEGTVTLVASDGRKLARTILSGVDIQEQHANFNLPPKPALLLKNVLAKIAGNLFIEFDAQRAVFTLKTPLENGEGTIDAYRIEARLLEGKYPNYNSVIPVDNPYRLILNHSNLLRALRNVTLSADAQNKMVKLTIDAGKLRMDTKNDELGQVSYETVECEYEGPHIDINFNGYFFLETLNSVFAENLELQIGDSSRAAIVKPVEQEENVDQTVLMMPIIA